MQHNKKTALHTHLILFEHLTLAEGLHGVDLACVDLLDQAHLTKRAFSNDLDGSKVFEAKAGAAESEEGGFGAS